MVYKLETNKVPRQKGQIVGGSSSSSALSPVRENVGGVLGGPVYHIVTSAIALTSHDRVATRKHSHTTELRSESRGYK